jgi:phosphoribosylformylglycinamidine (FGAM) synthase PurS component
MGYTQISELAVGKLVTLTVASPSPQAAVELANQLANTVLSNPVIETFTTTIVDDSSLV